jgi:putative two-component system response regulator
MAEPIAIEKDATEEGSKILVVDDNEMNRDLLARRLKRHGHEVLTAHDGLNALEILNSHRVDLVLLDIMMPNLDGYQVLEKMKADEYLADLPVIMITAVDELDSAVKCIEMGADDYLTKPFNAVLLGARINASLEKHHLRRQEQKQRQQIEDLNLFLTARVRQQVAEIASAQIGAIFAMSKLAESRDPETGEHLDRMREYCRLLAKELSKQPKYAGYIDKTYIENIYSASPLHDIGKVGVPDAILSKPGKLTDEEWVIMKTHPVIGAETLREVDREHPGNAFIQTGIEIAASHHEKWDGSGYPYGLSGEDIPLSARILALGDVYDALTSKRCYKEAMAHNTAVDIIREGEGKHFDPDVISAFLGINEEFVRIREYFQDSE